MIKKIIAANWKANPKTVSQARALFLQTAAIAKREKKYTYIVCPPCIYIPETVPLKKAGIAIGSQTVSHIDGGPYTGEVSAAMLKSIGVTHGIVGHSERRSLGETDEMINQKMIRSLAAGLTPILAIGETEHDNEVHTVLEFQLRSALRGVAGANIKHIMIAYEPRWAISKGVGDQKTESDTPEHAFEKAIFIRRIVAKLYSSAIAGKIPILYGGSVRSSNVHGFLNGTYAFDGILVGGASANAKEFAKLIQNA